MVRLATLLVGFSSVSWAARDVHQQRKGPANNPEQKTLSAGLAQKAPPKQYHQANVTEDTLLKLAKALNLEANDDLTDQDLYYQIVLDTTVNADAILELLGTTGDPVNVDNVQLRVQTITTHDIPTFFAHIQAQQIAQGNPPLPTVAALRLKQQQQQNAANQLLDELRAAQKADDARREADVRAGGPLKGHGGGGAAKAQPAPPTTAMEKDKRKKERKRKELERRRQRSQKHQAAVGTTHDF